MDDILKSALNAELIELDVLAQDQNDIISKLANLLYEKGYVKDSYESGVKQREQVYPTGLYLGKYSVAIPHTESEHVNESAIAIARLSNPVTFKYMADPSMELSVQLVMMLAIKDPSKQVPVLSQLMQKVANSELIDELMTASTVEEFMIILTKEEK